MTRTMTQTAAIAVDLRLLGPGDGDEEGDIYKNKPIEIKSIKIKPIDMYLERETNKNLWRIRDEIGNSSGEFCPPGETLPHRSLPRERCLEPLDAVFIDDTLKDDVVVAVGIPDLLDGMPESEHSGVILYGPPGTGKTVLLDAICQVYANAGAYAKQISVSQVNSFYVGEYAKRLETELIEAIKEARKRGRPSFVSFDEGSTLVQVAENGAVSVAKHYQEAIDVLKRYLGNCRELVMGVSTNFLPESFEAAMTREGRLTTYFIGYPDREQRKRMWEHFLTITGWNRRRGINQEQFYALAEATPEEQGAFIEEFCRTYDSTRRNAWLKAKGFRTLVDALKCDVEYDMSNELDSISFETILSDVEEAIAKKAERNGQNKKGKIGF